MASSPDKERVLRAMRELVREEQARMEASQREVQAGAVHPETRQEDPKDTRAIEAGYLARGLAERAETLRTTAALLDAFALEDFGDDTPIGVSALVTLEDEDGGELLHVFLVPAAASAEVALDGRTVKTVTPRSPLGQALVGREQDDGLELRTPAGARRYRVAGVA